jgi:hypothetical protein
MSECSPDRICRVNDGAPVLLQPWKDRSALGFPAPPRDIKCDWNKASAIWFPRPTGTLQTAAGSAYARRKGARLRVKGRCAFGAA